MQGDEFHAFLLLEILLFICFSSDRCVASGSGKIEKGYDAAKERIDKYWKNKFTHFNEEIQVVLILSQQSRLSQKEKQVIQGVFFHWASPQKF